MPGVTRSVSRGSAGSGKLHECSTAQFALRLLRIVFADDRMTGRNAFAQIETLDDTRFRLFEMEFVEAFYGSRSTGRKQRVPVRFIGIGRKSGWLFG